MNSNKVCFYGFVVGFFTTFTPLGLAYIRYGRVPASEMSAIAPIYFVLAGIGGVILLGSLLFPILKRTYFKGKWWMVHSGSISTEDNLREVVEELRAEGWEAIGCSATEWAGVPVYVALKRKKKDDSPLVAW
ncbi:hypothetical protein LCGC14_1456310 [marine sediment metagenome]|uniref:Uncharacterized protein n=1 Tax=marine sediment metagenome TaxID=412755 RepID=A0A0F9JH53_9ZZZZ